MVDHKTFKHPILPWSLKLNWVLYSFVFYPFNTHITISLSCMYKNRYSYNKIWKYHIWQGMKNTYKSFHFYFIPFLYYVNHDYGYLAMYYKLTWTFRLHWTFCSLCSTDNVYFVLISTTASISPIWTEIFLNSQCCIHLKHHSTKLSITSARIQSSKAFRWMGIVRYM